MKQLVSSAANFMSVQDTPLVELIFVTSEREYRLTKKSLVANDVAQTFRFCTDQAGIKTLILSLMDYDKQMEAK